jgi:hypothetical protein
MGRRKYILHEYTTDRVKEDFGRIRLQKKQQNQSRTTSRKVSKRLSYNCMTDTLSFFDADNPIMMEKGKKEK